MNECMFLSGWLQVGLFTEIGPLSCFISRHVSSEIKKKIVSSEIKKEIGGIDVTLMLFYVR